MNVCYSCIFNSGYCYKRNVVVCGVEECIVRFYCYGVNCWYFLVVV